MQWLDAAADSIASAISGDGPAPSADEATPEEEEEARLQETPGGGSSWSWWSSANESLRSVSQKAQGVLRKVEETVDQFAERQAAGGGSGGDEEEEETETAVLAPWEGGEMEASKRDVLRAQILNLSQEKWIFLQGPSEEALQGFHFSMDEYSKQAIQCLRLDPQLEKMRWLLVPWKVREEAFWRNYFAHIFVVRNTVLSTRLDEEQLKRASGEQDKMGKRNMEELQFLEQLETSTGGKDDGEVVELSSLSIDGMSLEDQINLALQEDV